MSDRCGQVNRSLGLSRTQAIEGVFVDIVEREPNGTNGDDGCSEGATLGGGMAMSSSKRWRAGGRGHAVTM